MTASSVAFVVEKRDGRPRNENSINKAMARRPVLVNYLVKGIKMIPILYESETHGHANWAFFAGWSLESNRPMLYIISHHSTRRSLSRRSPAPFPILYLNKKLRGGAGSGRFWREIPPSCAGEPCKTALWILMTRACCTLNLDSASPAWQMVCTFHLGG